MNISQRKIMSLDAKITKLESNLVEVFRQSFKRSPRR